MYIFVSENTLNTFAIPFTLRSFRIKKIITKKGYKETRRLNILGPSGLFLGRQLNVSKFVTMNVNFFHIFLLALTHFWFILKA